jgi:TusA-related sulfurtransferase
MPIVKTRDAMRELVAGELLEMLSDDPASEADMKSWSARTGHALVEVSHDGGIYRFLIRKVGSRGSEGAG